TSTATESFDAKTGQFHVSASSRLSVLAPGAAGALSLVGEIPSLVDNERLMSTRFIGDKGYAVTFRNVDPLVTLDLSDPAHPRKVAELTIPGFSTYLQPIDDDHLLAIGEDLPLDSTGHPDWSRRRRSRRREHLDRQFSRHERRLHPARQRRLELVVPPLGPPQRHVHRSIRQHLRLRRVRRRPPLRRPVEPRQAAGHRALPPAV